MSRIDWLSPQEISLVEADLKLMCQQFDCVIRRISGRAPARVIDRTLAVEERLWRFAVNLPDALQPPTPKHNH